MIDTYNRYNNMICNRCTTLNVALNSLPEQSLLSYIVS